MQRDYRTSLSSLSLKLIGITAFAGSGIQYVDIPENVVLQQGAFAYSQLKEAYIAGHTTDIGEELIFSNCSNLEKLIIGEGPTYIPISFAQNCINLKELRIPSTVTDIYWNAFDGCKSLTKLELPDGLKSISTSAFLGLESLEEIVFPDYVVLESGSCSGWKSIKRIYSKSPEPPKCYIDKMYPQVTPFGDKDATDGTDASRETPVYVPIGSAEKYRSAPGWDYFTNFIETDNFPVNGVNVISQDGTVQDENIYDLHGRKVTNPQRGEIYIQKGKKVILLR